MRAALVEALYREGQSAWPLVELDYVAFENHCARLPLSKSDDARTYDGAGLYLCCACADGNAAAVAAFESHCLETATAAISRIRGERDFVQEALQEFRQRALVGPPPKVLDYQGRGPLQAWARVAALRIALDSCRGQRLLSERQLELNEGLVSAAPSPELALLRERYLPEFRSSLQRALAELDAQERNVLRMHVVGQCSIDEIGRAYGVHRATAARWLERTRQRIYQTIRGEVSARHGKLTDSEFKSLARGLGGELSLGLSGGSARSSHLVSTPPT
jgi:RNA polymerase sigma-70 factor (ECF subfamily)